MPSTQNLVIERPDDLSADWLTATLGVGPVTGFRWERIGTGQMSECYRVELTYADGVVGPQSVVLKVAATDVNSRQTGLALGLYEREVRFYSDIAPGLSGPLAPCFHTAFDPESGAFDLLLGDARPAVVGDEIRGATSEHATLALVELARLHGPLIGDTTLAHADWLNRESPINQALLGQLYAAFIDRYGDQVPPAYREVCERLVSGFDDYLAAESAPDRVRGLVHGDYRLDNMLFGQAGAERTLTVVDWQTVTWGPATTDVAYFLGCALTVETRRTHYDTLLRAYHAALGDDSPLTLEDVRAGVRGQSFFGVTMAIASSMLVERTERGDRMFMTMLERHCEHVLDTDALAVLPASSAPAPLVPDAEDEGSHEPTDEPLWNESWYFDFADAGQDIGGWVRLGLIPNQGEAWINVLLAGPDIPTIALNDFHVTLPQDHAQVSCDTGELTLDAVEPLQVYRVSARGRAQAYADPAALLRDTGVGADPSGAAEDVDLELELTWTTAGAPYQYRITPRYEIPCTVSGSIRFGDRRYDVNAVPGQRDHSWGARDWWGMDWVWSALHLDDGSHLHGIDLRIPGIPPVGIGYVQPPGEPLVELDSVTAEATFDHDDLPLSTSLSLEPGGVDASISVRGHAPVRLVAPDGRVSLFARAWATVSTVDGRTGIGWLEWNRNQG
jgi:hypothetical protein